MIREMVKPTEKQIAKIAEELSYIFESLGERANSFYDDNDNEYLIYDGQVEVEVDGLCCIVDIRRTSYIAVYRGDRWTPDDSEEVDIAVTIYNVEAYGEDGGSLDITVEDLLNCEELKGCRVA